MGTDLILNVFTMKQSNNLKHTIKTTDLEGNTLIIKIHLNDECKNGHQDFSITGNVYEKGKPLADKYNICCGAIGDEIVKVCPGLEIFNDLHLCDYNGAPMYAIENGFYHLNDVNNRMTQEKFCKYYGVTTEQYTELVTACDKQHFKILLYTLGIVDQWKAKATKAICILEKMTGTKFLNDSTRSQLEPLTEEEIKIHGERVVNGYYLPESILKRAETTIASKRIELKQNTHVAFDKAVLKLKKQLVIDNILIDLFLTTSNVIFYNHTNMVVFNWQDSTYEKKYTESDFRRFAAIAKRKALLKDIQFTLKS